MARRLLQLELAVERSPGDPDFTGLSEVVGGTTTEGGAAMTSKFREWAASRQKDREQVFKQARLEREELGHTGSCFEHRHLLAVRAVATDSSTGTCLRSAPSPPSAHRAPFIPVNWDGAVPDLVVPQNAVVLARDHQVRPQDLESKPAGDLDGDVWRCKSWRSFDGRLLQGSLCAWRGFGPRKIGVTYWDVSGAVGHITYGTQWLWVFGNWRTGRHDGRERLLLRQPLGAGRSLAGAGPCGGQDAGD